MKIIFGLGNFGDRYIGTRHNIGVVAVRAFAAEHGMEWKNHRFRGYDSAEGVVGGENVLCVTTRGFMNTSGTVLKSLHAAAEDVVLIHDELAVPTGQLKISKERGAAGHNGVASVINQLHSKDFARLRIGISPEGTSIPVPSGEARANFVLGKFSPEERTKIESTVPRAVEALTVLVTAGIERAMERFN